MDLYEKKYKEALNKAKELMTTSVVFDRFTIERIFPELKESEDEKIKEAIIDIIESQKEQQCHIDSAIYNKMIAWLEKQGDYHKGFRDDYNSGIHEEKPLKWTKHDELVRKETISCLKHWKNCIPTTWNEDYKNILMWLENELSVHTEKQSDKSQGKSALEVINEEKVDSANKVEPKDYRSIDPHFFKSADKIEKQPSQWNISDYRTWQYIVSDVLTKHDGIGQYLDNGEYKKIAKYMQEEWSKKLSLELNTAWSEEDESMLFNVINRIEQLDHYWNKPTDEKLIDWFKSLKDRVQPQPKQKWSELDRSKIQRICKYLEEAKKYYADITEVRECIEWLTSLKDKYTWKPSDKQINALENFTRSVGESGYFSPYDDNTKLLYSLLEDLKKL